MNERCVCVVFHVRYSLSLIFAYFYFQYNVAMSAVRCSHKYAFALRLRINARFPLFVRSILAQFLSFPLLLQIKLLKIRAKAKDASNHKVNTSVLP